jgi:LEA14-like dessication related protein
MKIWYFLLLLTLTLTSCANFKEPEFISSDGFKLEKMDGKVISFSAGAKVHNPNWFGIKIKPSHVEVYVEEQLMGNVYLEKKVKMKAKRDSDLKFQLRAELEDGAMITAMRYSNKDNVSVRIKGKVKGGVFIFSKKMEIDETRTVSGKNLRMGGMK